MKLFVLVVICQLFIARSLNNRDRASAKRTSILKDINSSSDNDNCRNAYSSWHKLYTAMHQKVLNGTLPARYLVSIAPHQGLADRIGTLPTHFLWALLTQRALVLATPHDVIPLSEIYDFPNLKLDLPQVLQDSSDSLTNLSYDGYPSSIDKSQRIGMNMVLNQQLGQTNGSLYRHIVKLSEVVFAKRNLSNYPLHHTDTSVFSIISNRGETWKIYNNPNHQQQLYDLGFRRPLLFHCIFSYLLSLRPQSCNAKCQEIEKSMLAVRQNHSNVIIGVQLRLGDVAAFGASPNNASSPSKHGKTHILLHSILLYPNNSLCIIELMPSNIIEKFVLCTNRLSVEVAREQGKQPLIFVISDSRDVRRHFVEQFGENRVLVSCSAFDSIDWFELTVGVCT